MKKNYNTPSLILLSTTPEDLITTSVSKLSDQDCEFSDWNDLF